MVLSVSGPPSELRDPRVVVSFDAPRDRQAFMNPYAALRARATIEDRAASSGYSIERIGGVGPCATRD